MLEEQLLLSGQESSQLERDGKGQEGSQEQRKREYRGREKEKSPGKEKELEVQEAQEKKSRLKFNSCVQKELKDWVPKWKCF